jgi:hypothetical protein
MDGRTRGDVDARYRRSLGVRAGYLPKDRDVVDEWHALLATQVQSAGLPRDLRS